jgi:hypothetical protein
MLGVCCTEQLSECAVMLLSMIVQCNRVAVHRNVQLQAG